MKTKKLLIGIVAVLCFSLAGVLVGCGPSVSAGSSSSSDTASTNRAYMSSANTIIEELEENLSDFSLAVANDDLVSMKSAAKKANKSIDKFEALKAPDDLKSVHDEYTKGFDYLKKALGEYIDLYSDQQKSALTESEYKKRLKSIMSEYDKGMKHLNKGDDLATSM